MIKKLKIFTLQMVAGANIASIVLMLAVGYSDRLHPDTFPLLSNAGLAFPAFLIINFGFLVFWLIFKTRGALIPLVGFIICYAPIRKFWPINIPQEPPPGAIKVLSYNVWYFAGWEDRPESPNPILEYIKKQNADIVCLQESATNEVGQEKFDAALNPIYQYRDTARRGQGECITILSKYPIIAKEHIDYESRGNLSAAFKLMIDGEEVIVINNHLETTALSVDEKHRFKTMIKGEMEMDTVGMTSKLLIRKLAKATSLRAPEAEAVARYVAYHRDKPVIVCGDFNDGPISYTHRTIARDLTDCYIATANGPGVSYHHSGIYVRIDHILCSSHFKPYACRVDNSISSSDHYPIISWLEKRPNSTKNE